MIGEGPVELPAGLADPLHLPFPVPWKLLAILGTLLLVAILFLLLRRWLRRRRRRAPRKPLPAPVPASGPGIADVIQEIRKRYRRSRAYRTGCHKLSEVLRGHFEQATQRRYSTLTAGEIHREVGETATARFFSFLAELQFGRRQPSRNDLEGACDLALEVAQREIR